MIQSRFCSISPASWLLCLFFSCTVFFLLFFFFALRWLILLGFYLGCSIAGCSSASLSRQWFSSQIPQGPGSTRTAVIFTRLTLALLADLGWLGHSKIERTGTSWQPIYFSVSINKCYKTGTQILMSIQVGKRNAYCVWGRCRARFFSPDSLNSV